MLRLTPSGLYCERGDFFVDPWDAVDRAVVTHTHPDHAHPGSRRYLATRDAAALLRQTVGDATIECAEYGEPVDFNGVRVSLHPAGHLLGSAQVRIEHRGEVWVVSGDYKPEPDPTCEPFEALRCHTFVTEAAFGLPIYRWRPQAEVFAEVDAWWRANRERGRASVLFAYPSGKAQRLLAGIDVSIGPVYAHQAVERINTIYRDRGVNLPISQAPESKKSFAGALIVAPLAANGTPWARRLGPASTGLASGWMRIRGPRRRRAVDRGFVLSDHVDWPGLLSAIAATGCERVLVTHGYRAALARWITSQGLEAGTLETRFEGERDEEPGA